MGQSAQPMAQPMDPNAAPNPPGAPPAGDAEELHQVTAGLASLDVNLPQRGKLYSFRTPRGELEIQARSIPAVAVAKLAGLGAVLAAIVIVWLLGREKSRRAFAAIFHSLPFAVAMIVAGIASVIVGVFPIAGLGAIVTGVVLVIRNRLQAQPAAVAA